MFVSNYWNNLREIRIFETAKAVSRVPALLLPGAFPEKQWVWNGVHSAS
jgi:hypothetical protein